MRADAIFWWEKWMHLCPMTGLFSTMKVHRQKILILKILKKVPELDRNVPQENLNTLF